MPDVSVLPRRRDFLERGQKTYVDELMATTDGATSSVFYPVPSVEISRGLGAASRDADTAVLAARRAVGFDACRHPDHSECERMIWRLPEIIQEHSKESLGLESISNGQKAPATAADVPPSVGLLAYRTDRATELEGTRSQTTPRTAQTAMLSPTPASKRMVWGHR